LKEIWDIFNSDYQWLHSRRARLFRNGYPRHACKPSFLWPVMSKYIHVINIIPTTWVLGN